MIQRTLLRLALPAIGLALAFVAPAAAGPLGVGWGSYGNGYHGNGYYGNGYHANSGWNGYYGNGNYVNSGNYAAFYDPPTDTLNYGNHYYYGSAYSPWYGYSYGWNAFPATVRWTYAPTGPYSSSNPWPGSMANVGTGTALIDVHLPASADLWFGSARTIQRGTNRQFVTPELNPNADSVYPVRARWMENGHVMEQMRRIHLRPGMRARVDFLQPSAADDADDQTINPQITGPNETRTQNEPYLRSE